MEYIQTITCEKRNNGFCFGGILQNFQSIRGFSNTRWISISWRELVVIDLLGLDLKTFCCNPYANSTMEFGMLSNIDFDCITVTNSGWPLMSTPLRFATCV